MLVNTRWIRTSLFSLFAILLMSAAHARVPMLTLIPVVSGSTAITLSSTGSAQVQYTVTNQSNQAYTVTMIPMVGINASGCEAPLGNQQSCLLTLTIQGNALTGDVIGGPIVCNKNTVSQCYQPNTSDNLAIHFSLTPTVAGVVPNAGPTSGSTYVTLTGTGFTNALSVTIGGNQAGFSVIDDQTLTVLTPYSTIGAADVVVTNLFGSGSAAAAYTYLDSTPVITGFAPSIGSPLGGDLITLVGSSFSGVVAVSIGGVTATQFAIVNDNTIGVITPPGTPGQATVALYTQSNMAVAPLLFSYDPSAGAAAPTITSISPNIGGVSGGTNVTIVGTSFNGLTGVTIGGIAATNVKLVSSTKITLTTPAGVLGAASLQVSAASGTVSKSFTYVSAPTMSGLTPATGSPAGGTPVTITGTGFGASNTPGGISSATTVLFGSKSGTINYSTSTSGMINVLTPANLAGPMSVVVTTPAGSITGSTRFNYAAVTPTITGVSPNSGSSLGGTSITISGSGGFTGTTSVTIGGKKVTGFTVNNDQSISAITPKGTLGAAAVVVQGTQGTSTPYSSYTYTAAPLPQITGFTPMTGSPNGGDLVTLSGQYFTGTTAVYLGSHPANFTFVNDSTLTVTTYPATSGTSVPVTVYTPTGNTTSSMNFTYQSSPSIPIVSVISPATGSTSGGTTVTITGSYFTNAKAVTIGGTAVQRYQVLNDSTITAVTPVGVGTTNNVVVTNPQGVSTNTVNFVYEAAPTIGSLSPNTGSPLGGTSVIIYGTSFDSMTRVTFGGVAAASYQFNNSGQVTVTTPPGKANTVVSVIVTNTVGSATSTFTYGASQPVKPTVASITPNIGSTSGGTAVTITGTNFTATTAVNIGNAVSSFNIVSDTTILATTAPGNVGGVSVSVTNPAGTGTGTNLFTYQAQPSISSISPTSGYSGGGTQITISGANFQGVTQVTIGGSLATGVTLINSQTISAITPAGSLGPVAVGVSTPAGSVSYSSFTYNTTPPSPIVTLVSPAVGSTAGGDTVTIKGNNFINVTDVAINAVSCSYSLVNAQTITATTPANATSGPVSVAVTAAGGTGTGSNLYTYQATPSISSIAPANGPIAGGTTITLTGTAFPATGGVLTWDSQSLSFTVLNSTTITAITPADTAKTVPVFVSNGSNSSNSVNFTYQASTSRTIGYLYGWEAPPPASAIAAAGYTHVIVAFAVFDTTTPGNLVSVNSTINAAYIKQLQSLGVKVLFSIGGASTSVPNTTTNFHAALAAAPSQSTFISRFIAAMDNFRTSYGFDGFDFDIEQGFNDPSQGPIGTFTNPVGDIAVVASIIQQYKAAHPGILLTLVPQVANISATSGFNATFGNYSSLILQVCNQLEWVGIQLYNTGCAFGIDQVCYGLPPTSPDNYTDSYAAFAVDLLANWPSMIGGVATGFQSYTGATCLQPSQVVLGFLVPNASGQIDGGGPAINIAAAQNALNCLNTGTNCHLYTPPHTYNGMGGVFSWSLNYDANNNYVFAKAF